MQTEDSTNAAEPAVNPVALLRKQRILIRLQVLLTAALIAVLLRAAVETRRANDEARRAQGWHQEASRLQATLDQQEQGVARADEPRARQTDTTNSKYHKATLIGEDGSRTPLEGKSIQLELGQQKVAEIYLENLYNNYLTIWAPAHRDDDYFHRIALHPGCANVLHLDLVRVNLKEGSASEFGDRVSYDAPR